MEPRARRGPRGPRDRAAQDRARGVDGVGGGRRHRLARPLAALAAGLLLAGCVARRPPELAPADGPLVGLYKGRLGQAGGATRGFRLLLYAALPDRLHGEVLSPLGAPQLILDGGDGMLAATLVERGQSFVGPAEPAMLGRLLGARVELRQLVQGLVLGEWDVPGYRFERRGATPGLPASLAIDDGSTRLSLELRRLRPLEVDAAGLGSGRPPEGVEVRPLAELEAEDWWVAPPVGAVEGS